MKNIIDFQAIDRSMVAAVGGKGAGLGELSKIDGVRVPEGFCITTKVFNEIVASSDEFNLLLKELAVITDGDLRAIGKTSAKIRDVIKATEIPEAIRDEILRHLSRPGENTAFAIRSSATAEDLPTASFAGQHDTYLNVIGNGAVLEAITGCWASLFTERAVVYRRQNGFDHGSVRLAVVVQEMVSPAAAGIMFTADPVTSNRKVLSIDAGFGLGEAIVAGLVNADNYKVRDGKVVKKTISTKKLAVYAGAGGGTREEEIDPETRDRQALTDEQILTLASIGRKVEEHFGSPQDIEWCLADDKFYIVQSRPITTLYPVPEVNDEENHLYISVGHQQMMTDAMKPLGLSFFLLTTQARMSTAGGRLFVDIAPMLASPAGRDTMVNVLGKSDPIIKDALTNILDRGDFISPLPEDKNASGPGESDRASPPDYRALNDYDPTIVDDLIKSNQAAIEALKQNIQTRSGPELFDFIVEDIQQLKKTNSDSQSFGVIMTGMNAAAWINEKMNEWLGEKNAADTISQSVQNNITSEMGLGLLDVADVIRPYPNLIDYLQNAKDDNFFEELRRFDGGPETRAAIEAYLNKYGMRCAGEIDITKTRWSEKPITLVPILLNNVKNFGPGAGKQKFERGAREALKKEDELLERLRQLPDGEQKARETKRMIDLVRNFSGYREYPKYGIVSRYFVYKQALIKEADRLVRAGVIDQKDDIYYLTFEEFRDTVLTQRADRRLIDKRKQEYKQFEKLTPPRVMTSEGEIVRGRYKHKDLPEGALTGLAVSAGVIEGRARVILNMEKADLKDGDILVTTFTDPSWTPLFVSIKGLVTEVGGLMTHGAVIAREYGLAAVVGVENATRLIKDGQRIRVNGTEGYVELI